MNKKIIVGLVLLAVVIGGAYLWLAPSAPSGQPSVADDQVAPVTSVGSKPAPIVPTISGGTVQVDIKGFAFVSPTTRIGPGTKIIWRNMDDVAHSVIGPNFQSKLLKKGETFSYTFTQPGVYPYFCGVHPNMKGEINVR